MTITYDIDKDEVTMEEYDLHDFVIEMLSIDTSNEGRVTFHSINIDWRDYQPTDEESNELAKAIEDVITSINDLDSLVHDIAEYTC